jgi:hypothetical protein
VAPERIKFYGNFITFYFNAKLLGYFHIRYLVYINFIYLLYFFIIVENVIKNKFYAIFWLIFLWIPIFIALQDSIYLFYGSAVFIAMVAGYITGLWFNLNKPKILTNCHEVFKIISYSSYAIFLFYIPIISVMFIYLSKFNLNFEVKFIVFITLGLSISVASGYMIQIIYDKIIRSIKNIQINT